MADKKVSDLPSLNGADVDAADLLYIVDSSAGAAGSKKITVGQYQLAPVSGGTANGVVYLDGSKVATSGSGLVFDGANLGIGTSSPAGKVDSVSNAYAAFVARSSTSGAGQTVDALKATDSAAANFANAVYSATAHIWNYAGATEGMRLDASGNLGLGVTPSAWSGYTAFDVGSGSASFATAGGTADVALNAYNNAGWKYKTTGAASFYRQQSGIHYWFNAPSGTAGNAISFTQAMTLDASGNLGVGISSPQAVLHVNKATSSTFRLSATSVGIDIQSLDGAGYGLVSTYTNHPMVFSTNATERARITSSGDLLVGTTDDAATATTNGLICSGANPGFVVSRRSTGAAQTHLEFRNGGTNVGNISSSTTTTTYATTSDRRLKENIVPAPSASDAIDAIEIVSHDWKSAPDEHVTYGVIAQDLALVAPQAVLQGDDGDEIEKIWGVDYSKLVPMLIKEIQSLRARVAALEAK